MDASVSAKTAETAEMDDEEQRRLRFARLLLCSGDPGARLARPRIARPHPLQVHCGCRGRPAAHGSRSSVVARRAPAGEAAVAHRRDGGR
jgi:hypothetical protein